MARRPRRQHHLTRPSPAQDTNTSINGNVDRDRDRDRDGNGEGTRVARRVVVPRFRKRYATVFLVLGVLLGILASQWVVLVEREEPSGHFLDFFPQLQLQRPEWVEFLTQMYVSRQNTEVAKEPGWELARNGYRVHHPTVLVPGIVSTGLEVWDGEPCARKYFRERLWGTLTMLESSFFDTQCWFRHMQLDPETGLDPPGIMLRSAEGLTAADWLMPGFWVWGPLIESFAEIGYDPNWLFMGGYDWRLTLENLERRDRFFSRFQIRVEEAVRASGMRAVLVTHSWGGSVMLFFYHWVSHHVSPSWVEDNIEALVTIGSPWLGLPKAVPSLISGEMRDTAQLGALQTVLDNLYLGKNMRRDLFRSWGCITAMLPKGGDAFWSQDGVHMVSFTGTDEHETNRTIEGALDLIWERMGESASSLVRKTYAYGCATKDDLPSARSDPRRWSNPLESALPYAPTSRIYCLYGVGKDTEMGYYYRRDKGEAGSQEPNRVDVLNVDYTVDDPADRVRSGVRFGDGDGTVPLMSLGYMCVEGWKKPHLNPSGMDIITREYTHAPGWWNPRGGPTTADHVDILGNYELRQDILRIAAGHGDEVPTRVLSPIRELASAITPQGVEV